MRVSCPSCQTNYNIDDKRVPPGGAKLKCSKCQTLFPIKPPPSTPDDDAVPLPGEPPKPPSQSSAAIPLPGSGAPQASAGAIPLPGSGTPPASAGAIPLPGSGERFGAAGAIPLPGSGEPAAGAGAVPLPGAPSASSAAIPLPGLTAAVPTNTALGGEDPFASFDDGVNPGDRWDAEQTRVSSIPLPSEAFRDTTSVVPMPGPEPVTGTYPRAETPHDLFQQADTDFDFGAPPVPNEPGPDHGAIPLPGNDVPEAAPFDFDFAEPPPPAEASEPVALPGFGADDPFPADDGFGEAPAPPTAAIPLPGSDDAFAPPPPSPMDFDDFPPAPAPAAAAPESFDFDDLPAPASPPPQSYEADFSDLPAPAAPAPESFDFADLPSPAAAPPPAPAPAEDFSLDFQDLPSPASPPPPEMAVTPDPEPEPAQDFSLDFSDLPSPADSPVPAPMGAPSPLDDLPSPADPFSNAPSVGDPFAHTPSPAPSARAPVDVSADFGEVDFGGGSDDLEFDPTRKPGAVDDFEADLSAPLPPAKPSAPADGLEMLSFIDDTAKENDAQKSSKKRFHVRRRSGKTFGPFEEGVIVKMLEDGQLLGNEDVSTDSESWSAIGTVPAFQQAIQQLMESPTGSFGSPSEGPAATSQAQSSAETMERLKQLYEGRMAAVTVVDRRAETEQFRRRLPIFIGAGVLAVIALAGGSFGFTRYGAFGVKVLMPSKVKAGSPQFTQLEKARADLLADTFKSYSEARDATQKILAVKEFPEVRAVWCQAVFYLDRRYAAAKPAELARARAELPNIELLGGKHPEVVKALAGEALASSRPDEARLLLEDAVVRNPKDLELKLLLAEAYVARKQPDRASQTLDQVLAQNATSAKALHAQGLLNQKKAETLRNAGKTEDAGKAAAKAEELFARALKADPNHVISAVELAALKLLVHGDVTDGQAALARALQPESQALMGPAEVSRARALNGTALSMQFKVKESEAEFQQALKLDPTSVFAKAQLGQIYVRQREFAKAVPLFKEASQKEPSNLDYVEGYLTVLIGSGKMQDALAVLQTANGQFPDTPRIAYLDARVNDALDNTKKAEDNYLRAIEGDPSLYEANLNLARLFLRLKRPKEARGQLEKAIARAPEDAAVNAGMGELLLEEQHIQEAKAAFEKSAQLDPTLPDAQLGLSRVALIEGRVQDAEAAINQALQLDPHLKGGYLQKGEVLWKEEKLDEAVAALEEAKKNEPLNARISIQMGAVKLQKGDLAGAEAALLAALTQEPRNPEANFYLARVKSRRAEHTQAIESMRSALEAAPKNAMYHNEMGLILRDAKKLADAMAEWKIAIELDPTYTDAMESLGQAYLDAGDFAHAIEQFEAALKVDPSRARLLALIGNAHFQAAEWDEAIARYRSALQQDPSLTFVYYKIGRSLSESGKSGQAIDWYRKATQVDEADPMPWYYLGYLYKERNQRKPAIEAFKAYLAHRADAPDKREIEDEIYDLEH